MTMIMKPQPSGLSVQLTESAEDCARRYDPTAPFIPVTLPLPGVSILLPADPISSDAALIPFCDYPADTDDPQGEIALELGAMMYHRGMDTQDEEAHEFRVAAFKAAELLYLHAAKRGNPIAFANLGYVYSYNRCEGEFWELEMAKYLPQGSPQPGANLPQAAPEPGADSAAAPQPGADPAMAAHLAKTHPFNEIRAFECYKYASEQGEPESCYKLGDLIMKWSETEDDRQIARGYYETAYDLSKGDDPVLWGSAALRLARCYEEGRGASRNPARAVEFYRIAVAGLEAAVEAGDWFYERSLAHARKGLKRAQQELQE